MTDKSEIQKLKERVKHLEKLINDLTEDVQWLLYKMEQK